MQGLKEGMGGKYNKNTLYIDVKTQGINKTVCIRNALAVVAHTSNPITWEAETGESV